LGWSHISLTGDYLWEQAAIAMSSASRSDGFNILRGVRLPDIGGQP
jgi:hypothetical protein